ncbi:sensor histidine kinase [Actinoallomurus rhizosphaericola]|uniref:sensor histidine kinase n=1 Tax=Actinoallomurus rhizosphaericola TaxID=2952536 RepID=UPI0020918030|nr:histidine kinase [Actinoallomurus rhizosphaericola]MCO5994391.1 histidine kinase [Actinoallomurus rhizosphaericola]
MFARLFAWLRRHPRLVDLLWALPLTGMSLALTSSYTSPGIPGRRVIPWYAYLVFVTAMCVPMIWRRRWPRATFAILAAVALVQWALDVQIGPADFNLFVALYTVAAACAFRWSLAAALVVELGAVMATWRWQKGPNSFGSWSTLLPQAVFTGAMWMWGLYMSTRRKYTAELEERAKRLERERDAHAQVAAAAERARIAREMHDVIAHSVSVMVVQADGASYMVDIDPARARRAMETIGATGRQALTEMRRMLGVLREREDAGPYAPQPGVEQLAELVDQIRSAGLPVGLTIEGVPSELPTALQLTVYRIVQEALTNTRKHAGPAATAEVNLHYGDEAVEIRIRDDGRGAATLTDGQGHGLVGMNERAALYGGSVRTGPRPGGGWEVFAHLPVTESRRAETSAA